jgi:hypothetical protein
MSPNTRLQHASAPVDDWRELAARENDGLEVRLVWSKAVGRVKVRVRDAKDGGRFDLDVPGADALSVFYHPFAYASALAPERSAA